MNFMRELLIIIRGHSFKLIITKYFFLLCHFICSSFYNESWFLNHFRLHTRSQFLPNLHIKNSILCILLLYAAGVMPNFINIVLFPFLKVSTFLKLPYISFYWVSPINFYLLSTALKVITKIYWRLKCILEQLDKATLQKIWKLVFFCFFSLLLSMSLSHR